MPDEQKQTIAEWMHHYGKAVWDYIYALTNDSATADDLSQDVFIQAYLKLSTFRSDSSPKTWLFAIARNKTRDYIKSAGRRRVVLTNDLQNWDFGTGPSAEDEALHFFASHQLALTVFRLKPIYREAVVLHIKEGLTFREIAMVTKSSESAIKARYRRALQMLRKNLQKEGLFHGTRRQDTF